MEGSGHVLTSLKKSNHNMDVTPPPFLLHQYTQPRAHPASTAQTRRPPHPPRAHQVCLPSRRRSRKPAGFRPSFFNRVGRSRREERVRPPALIARVRVGKPARPRAEAAAEGQASRPGGTVVNDLVVVNHTWVFGHSTAIGEAYPNPNPIWTQRRARRPAMDTKE